MTMDDDTEYTYIPPTETGTWQPKLRTDPLEQAQAHLRYAEEAYSRATNGASYYRSCGDDNLYRASIYATVAIAADLRRLVELQSQAQPPKRND